MRYLFIATFLANLALALASLVILPERVAMHFGLGGAPDGWGSNLANAAVMIVTHILVFSSLYFSPRLLTAMPGRWTNLPNRGFWLRPENRPEAIVRLSRCLWQFGTAVFLFMLFAGALTIKANLADPVRLDEGLFLAGLVVFLLYTAYWMVVLMRTFRIPKGGGRA